MYGKAIEINPNSGQAYVHLGQYYSMQGKYDKAEEMFRKALEREQKSEDIYLHLGWLCWQQGKYEQTEGFFKNGISENPGSKKLNNALSLFREEQDKMNGYMGDDIEKDYVKNYECNSITCYNYRRLMEFVTQRGLRLVCVQYPLRKLEPLKKMLQPNERVIFVDNEMVFKNAIQKGTYKEYFEDIFAGDFGHCTDKGNRLLAENIADVILREYFNK